MTETTRQLIDQLERELDELPVEKQEEAGRLLLTALRQHKRAHDAEDEAEPYSSFRVLRRAQFDGQSDESTTFEETLYGLNEDDG